MDSAQLQEEIVYYVYQVAPRSVEAVVYHAPQVSEIPPQTLVIVLRVPQDGHQWKEEYVRNVQ